MDTSSQIPLSAQQRVPNHKEDPVQSPLTAAPHTKRSPVRTLVASIFGTIAILLIPVSVLVVWLNQTLTNTTNYVAVVGPLISKPAVQNLVAQKITNQLLNESVLQNFGANLGPAEVSAIENTMQLKGLTPTEVQTSVLQVVQSPKFVSLWTDTNRSLHATLIAQLRSGAPTLTLNVAPFVTGVVNDFTSTVDPRVAALLQINASKTSIGLTGDQASSLDRSYFFLQDGVLLVVGLATVSLLASVGLSLSRLRTLRRILFGAGVGLVLLAAALYTTAHFQATGADPLVTGATVAIIPSITHGLRNDAFVVGLICLGIATGSKLISLMHRHTV
jgi:hypothetical protein